MKQDFLIETQRLKLRELSPSDAEWFFQLNNDPEVIQYTGDLPFDDVEQAAQFLRSYDQYEKYGCGRWAVVRKADEAVLGWCGLRYLPSMDSTDLGFRFFREFWGQGYATEASIGCLDYGFRELGLQKIIGRAMKLNVASVRVLMKVGMTKVGEFDFEEHPGVLFEMTRSSWSSKQVRS